MKEDLNSLVARLAEELSNYIYFLLAASGAAIAYALEQAEGKALSKELIVVILALFAWCGSFYFGVRHLRLHRQHMIENAKALLADETFQQMQKRLEPFIEKMEKGGRSSLRLPTEPCVRVRTRLLTQGESIEKHQTSALLISEDL